MAFMFYTPVPSTETDDDCPNLQFAIENSVLGLEWVLLGPRNIVDRSPVVRFIRKRGHKVETRQTNDVTCLRVETGDIGGLGQRIVEELYRMPSDADVGVLLSDEHAKANSLAWLLARGRRSC